MDKSFMIPYYLFEEIINYVEQQAEGRGQIEKWEEIKILINMAVLSETISQEHNGKVERSHRNDNERFYSYLKFYSFEDLLKQGKAYLKRSNNIPMAVLGYLTPKEKRAELMCA